jgi:hypothetical protein
VHESEPQRGFVERKAALSTEGNQVGHTQREARCCEVVAQSGILANERQKAQSGLNLCRLD